VITVRTVRGDLALTAAQSRVIAERGHIPEINKILFLHAVRPAQAAVKAAALGMLPKAGGLNKRVARRPRATVSQSRTKVSAKITLPVHLAPIDMGTVTHPLYGNRAHWFAQRVAPGFFTGTLIAMRPVMESRTRSAIESYISKELEGLGKV
jgi:hypothetical protein